MKISEFIKNPKNFLVYCGNAGIGKTHLAAALVEFGLTKFNSFRYWHEGDLLKKVRASIDEYKNSDYLDCLNYLIDDEFIILDDIGSSGLTEWRKEILFEAIDFRYCSMLPTVIITNFSKKEIRSLYHERLASRIFATENIVIEIHDGPDLRQKEEKNDRNTEA